jgi:hypothetical protein
VAIAGALARIGDGRAFEPLLALIGDDDAGVRHAAIGALNRSHYPAMASRIRALLADSNPHVRESAVRVAGFFGTPRASTAWSRAAAARTKRSGRGARASAVSTIRARSTPCGTRWPRTPRARRPLRMRSAGSTTRPRRRRALLEQAVATPTAWSLLRRDRHRPPRRGALLPVLATAGEDRHRPARSRRAVGALGAVGGERALAISRLAAAGKPDLANGGARARTDSLRRSSAVGAGDPRRRPRRRSIAAEALAATEHGDAVGCSSGRPRRTPMGVARAAVSAGTMSRAGAGRAASRRALATATASRPATTTACARSRVPVGALPGERLSAGNPACGARSSTRARPDGASGRVRLRSGRWTTAF